MGNCCSTRFE
jgi:hypothetical protein